MLPTANGYRKGMHPGNWVGLPLVGCERLGPADFCLPMDVRVGAGAGRVREMIDLKVRPTRDNLVDRLPAVDGAHELVPT